MSEQRDLYAPRLGKLCVTHDCTDIRSWGMLCRLSTYDPLNPETYDRERCEIVDCAILPLKRSFDV